MASPSVSQITHLSSCERFVHISDTTLHQRRVDLVHRLRESPRVRRRHTKSRTGCVTCKRRRIKVRAAVHWVLKLSVSDIDLDCSAMKRSQHVVTAGKGESLAFGPERSHLESQAHLRHHRECHKEKLPGRERDRSRWPPAWRVYVW